MSNSMRVSTLAYLKSWMMTTISLEAQRKDKRSSKIVFRMVPSMLIFQANGLHSWGLVLNIGCYLLIQVVQSSQLHRLLCRLRSQNL